MQGVHEAVLHATRQDLLQQRIASWPHLSGQATSEDRFHEPARIGQRLLGFLKQGSAGFTWVTELPGILRQPRSSPR